MRIETAHWDILANPDATSRVTSSDVEFPLAARAAQSLGRALVTERAEGRVAVTF